MPSGWRPRFSGRGALVLLAVGAAAAQQASPPDPPLHLEPHGAAPSQKQGKRKPKAGLLPRLQPHKAAQRLGQGGGPAGAGSPAPTVAALPAPAPRRRIPVEQSPYDPLGERIGNLRLPPYIEEDLGWSSNPASAAGAPKASAFETAEAGAALQSDWSRNDLHGQVKAGYSDYFEAPEASGPYGAGNLDVGVSQRDATTTFGLKGEYRVNRDVVLRATATRQQFVSNVANSNYVSNVFMLGVRLQR